MCHPSSAKLDFNLRDSDGKAQIGCFLSVIALCLALFIASRVGPPFFAYKGLESDVKGEVSRAGAHVLTDDVIIKEVIAIAEKNQIRLAPENVKVERFAGQVQITVEYSVDVDLIVYQREMDFEIKASSFIGRL